MTKVICIGAGQVSTKKLDNKISRRHRYLNYGLLSLATVLKERGADPVVLHGHFDHPSVAVQRALRLGLQETKFPVLISLPSFYAVNWTREFISHAKAERPDLRFILGGRWVVDGRPDLLKALIPEADKVISGLAEGRISELVVSQCRSISLRTEEGVIGAAHISSLDYSLLDQRELYQPSLEVSRGCGMGCGFCQERSASLQPLKEPSRLVRELAATLLRDQLIEMTPYFEASMFVPSKDWVTRFRRSLDAAELPLRWRTEGRVDNIQPDLIPELAASGLAILDLGLESASNQQLLRMKKTKSPSRYLEKASLLLEACRISGVKVKVNLLLYAGETDDSLGETLAWLDARKNLIHGVSVGPVIAYGWPQSITGYLQELSEHGATIHHSPFAGVTHLNLSPTIDHERALTLSRTISRRYMSDENYFFLKSFSYFGRDYTYDEFRKDVLALPSDLSFDSAQLRADAKNHASIA